MNKYHLPLIVIGLLLISLLTFFYKVLYLNFPVEADVESPWWNVEAEISFRAKGKPVQAELFVPNTMREALITDESFISSGFGITTEQRESNRKVIWSTRTAHGRQLLFYRAVVRHDTIAQGSSPRLKKVPEVDAVELKGSKLAAAEAILAEAVEKSADLKTLVLEVIKQVNRRRTNDEVKLLLGRDRSDFNRAGVVSQILALRDIPARVVNGIRLVDESTNTPFFHWVEVFDAREMRWVPYDLLWERQGAPEHYFSWWYGTMPFGTVTGADRVQTRVAVNRNLDRVISSVLYDGHLERSNFLEFSLFSLPIRTQGVYRILVTIPLGVLLLVLLRNVIGIKTFGTFMPVLVALAFRETDLLWGIFLFVVVVGFGLLFRFYLENLKLLLVPRLAAVLIVVVFLMIGLSIVTHKMGIERGLSVALFPMVILTMAIERMTIVWEERGASDALSQGLGTLLSASICYLVMTWRLAEHLLFVFPELLLFLLAVTMLLGRYTGYRLTELSRFKEFSSRGANV